jgi:hypothetical protein
MIIEDKEINENRVRRRRDSRADRTSTETARACAPAHVAGSAFRSQAADRRMDRRDGRTSIATDRAVEAAKKRFARRPIGPRPIVRLARDSNGMPTLGRKDEGPSSRGEGNLLSKRAADVQGREVWDARGVEGVRRSQASASPSAGAGHRSGTARPPFVEAGPRPEQPDRVPVVSSRSLRDIARATPAKARKPSTPANPRE